MEMELNTLIEKIKKDGVEQAEKNASDILEKAEKEAKDIVGKAGAAKTNLINEAKIETDRYKDASIKALNQAARDVLLSLRSNVMSFFESVVKDKVFRELDPGVLKDIIIKAVQNFRKGGMTDIEVLISKEDQEKLEKVLFAALKEEAKKHVTVLSSKGVEKGFRIGEKGKDSYFDFTDEAIAESFRKNLSPRLLQVLDSHMGIKEEK